ncbi:hypothetical protein ABZ054_09305, partial [Streptomyces sp. NPDC006324]
MTTRRTRPAPRPPEGTPPRAELARQARHVLADAVRIARWAAVEGGARTAPRTGPGAFPPQERAAREQDQRGAQGEEAGDREQVEDHLP